MIVPVVARREFWRCVRGVEADSGELVEDRGGIAVSLAEAVDRLEGVGRRDPDDEVDSVIEQDPQHLVAGGSHDRGSGRLRPGRCRGDRAASRAPLRPITTSLGTCGITLARQLMVACGTWPPSGLPKLASSSSLRCRLTLQPSTANTRRPFHRDTERNESSILAAAPCRTWRSSRPRPWPAPDRKRRPTRASRWAAAHRAKRTGPRTRRGCDGSPVDCRRPP